MTTRPPGQLNEELRQMLRRIEEIPAGDARPDEAQAERDSARSENLSRGRLAVDASAWAKAAHWASDRGVLSARPLSIGAVGAVAALAAGWLLLIERPNAMNGRGTTDRSAQERVAALAARAESATDGSD